MATLPADDPLAVAADRAIRQGDVASLQRLLDEHAGLASASIVDACGVARSPLHIATDWPGHFPNGPATVRALVAAGADVDARVTGPHQETPLHWAASSDDVPVLDALLDLGADIEAPGSVIDGSTPLADAAAFGQWRAARRLVERGAEANLWQAAALGLIDRVEALLAASPPVDDVTNAFWCACHGGQLATAQLLLQRGAERDWIGHDGLTPLGAAERSEAADVVAWLQSVGVRR